MELCHIFKGLLALFILK